MWNWRNLKSKAKQIGWFSSGLNAPVGSCVWTLGSYPMVLFERVADSLPSGALREELGHCGWAMRHMAQICFLLLSELPKH